MHDAKAELAVPSPDGLGHLACGFPVLCIGRDVSVDIVADVGAQRVVGLCVVGVLDVELGEERFTVGSCWEVGRCHCE